MIALSPEGQRVEVELFGREGMTPASVAIGIDAVPYHIFAQMAGDAYRISAATLRQAIDDSSASRTLLARYLQTFHTQTSYTALSNALHQIDERCARWLLMVHDRIDGDDINLTHEFLSLMLAVRRPSVTGALHMLEGHRLIRADRGCITIRDRRGLQHFAGDAYGRPETEYAELIRPIGKLAA